MDRLDYAIKTSNESLFRKRLSKIPKDELVYAIILYDWYKQDMDEVGRCTVDFRGFLHKEYAIYKKKHEDEFYEQVYGKVE